MKALVLHTPNSLPILTDWPTPEPDPGEVLVKLKAAALNRRDYYITQGQYPGIQCPVVLGSDGAGEIDGRRVIINPGLVWGSSEAHQSAAFTVLGMPTDGCMAEYTCVPEEYIYDTPDHLDDIQAAALPLAGVTAYRALMVRGAAQAGDSVLITGIGGGVAMMALQMAVAHDCEVYVTSSSEEKRATALTYGAAGAYDYTSADWHRTLHRDSGGIDVVVDGAGGSAMQDIIKVCRPGARIAMYGGTAGKMDGISPQILFWRQLSLLGSTMGSPQDFKSMLDFVTERGIVPVVDSIYELEDFESAFAQMHTSTQCGKLVLRCSA